jgi:hypothetical protein
MRHEGHEGRDWIKDDVTFFNDAAEQCDIKNATYAFYHPEKQAIDIFEKDIDALVKAAQSKWPHGEQAVEKDSLREAFFEITEKLKLNSEKKAENDSLNEIETEPTPDPYAEAGIPAPGSYQTNDPTDEYGTYQPAENDDLRAENDSLKTENAALKAENAALKAENDSLSESIRSAKALNEAYETENEGLKQQLESGRGQGLEQE